MVEAGEGANRSWWFENIEMLLFIAAGAGVGVGVGLEAAGANKSVMDDDAAASVASEVSGKVSRGKGCVVYRSRKYWIMLLPKMSRPLSPVALGAAMTCLFTGCGAGAGAGAGARTGAKTWAGLLLAYVGGNQPSTLPPFVCMAPHHQSPLCPALAKIISPFLKVSCDSAAEPLKLWIATNDDAREFLRC